MKLAAALMRRAEEGAQTLRTAAACTLFGSGDEFIQQAISEEPPRDTKGKVTPVKGSRSREPNTFSESCTSSMLMLAQAAMA